MITDIVTEGANAEIQGNGVVIARFRKGRRRMKRAALGLTLEETEQIIPRLQSVVEALKKRKDASNGEARTD